MLSSLAFVVDHTEQCEDNNTINGHYAKLKASLAKKHSSFFAGNIMNFVLHCVEIAQMAGRLVTILHYM